MHRLLWLVLIIPLLPAAGMLYQWAGARRDKRRLLLHGTMVDVGDGRRMYLSQKGIGGPTVIFESGIAATSQNWMLLQESVSAFTRTVTYDRAGLGWSGPSLSHRTPSNIVRELRTLLQQAGVPPPYLLVGHSFGGLVVRHFAAEHPTEVVGVILVDPMRPEDWPPINEAGRATIERGKRLTTIAVPIASVGMARLAATSILRRSGTTSRIITRVAGAGGQQIVDRVACELAKMPQSVLPIIAAHWSTPQFYRGMAAHLHAVPATVHEMHEAKPIEHLQVLLLTPRDTKPLSSEALRRIGPSTQQVIAEKSGHWIHLDEPELVLGAIRTMINQIRSAAPENLQSIQH